MGIVKPEISRKHPEKRKKQQTNENQKNCKYQKAS